MGLIAEGTGYRDSTNTCGAEYSSCDDSKYSGGFADPTEQPAAESQTPDAGEPLVSDEGSGDGQEAAPPAPPPPPPAQPQIDVFISLDKGEETDEAKASWDKLLTDAKENGIVLNVYRVTDKTATKTKFLESISTTGRITVFIGHSVGHYALYFSDSNLKTGELDNKSARASIIAVFSCGRGALFDKYYSSEGTTMVYSNPGTGYLNLTLDSNYGAGYTFTANIVRLASLEDATSMANVTLQRLGNGMNQAADASIDSRVLPRPPSNQR